MGSGYCGSPSLLTSIENKEIIQQHKPANHVGEFSAYRFSFNNLQDCVIKINGGSNIFLIANQGFSMSYEDRWVNTFTIVTPDVQYNYVFAYK